jgi:hypothetical protein
MSNFSLLFEQKFNTVITTEARILLLFIAAILWCLTYMEADNMKL